MASAPVPVSNKIYIIQGNFQDNGIYIPKPSKHFGFAFVPPDRHIDLFLIMNNDDIYEHIYNIDKIPILKRYNKDTKVAECHLYLRPSPDHKGDFYVEVYDNPVIIHDVNWFNEMPVSVLNEYVRSFNKFFTNIYNINIV